MINSSEKVFIDSNMLIFSASFRQADVFEWMNQLYPNIYIHKEVYNELLTLETKTKVAEFIKSGQWQLFDPFNSQTLTFPEQEIYRQRLKDVTNAFHRMNINRISEGREAKSVSNIGEIATITACLMISARIICSNDFDIRTVVEQEDYRVLSENDEDVLIVQDSAEDFCLYCYQADISTRKLIRKFYKTIIFEAKDRDVKLAQLDNRLNQAEN